MLTAETHTGDATVSSILRQLQDIDWLLPVLLVSHSAWDNSESTYETTCFETLL